MTGAAYDYPLPGGGRGFTRPASLVSLWSTAPFLQNNCVGRFNPSPSVDARMRVFQDSIEQMLWPERRDKDRIFATDNGRRRRHHRSDDSRKRHLGASGFVPDNLRPLLGVGAAAVPVPLPRRRDRDRSDSAGLPGESAREHRHPRPQRPDVEAALASARRRCCEPLKQAKDELKNSSDIFANPSTMEMLLSLSKCKDFVVNKGHYFGTNLQTEETPLSDDDKRALIAFLKTSTDATNAHTDVTAELHRQSAPAPVVGTRRLARLAESPDTSRRSGAGGGRGGLAERRLGSAHASTPRHPTATPTTTTCRRFIRSPPRTPAMRWDFFVRHYSDDGAAAARPELSRDVERQAGRRRAVSARRRRSAAARRTTR